MSPLDVGTASADSSGVVSTVDRGVAAARGCALACGGSSSVAVVGAAVWDAEVAVSASSSSSSSDGYQLISGSSMLSSSWA